jgi:hypothetical protein
MNKLNINSSDFTKNCESRNHLMSPFGRSFAINAGEENVEDNLK